MAGGLMGDIIDQPPPTANGSRPIWELVIADMDVRDHIGRARYGTPLQAYNGRDALVDLYQELLDAVVYIRQVIEERKRLSLESALATTFIAQQKERSPSERQRLWLECLRLTAEIEKLEQGGVVQSNRKEQEET